MSICDDQVEAAIRKYNPRTDLPRTYFDLIQRVGDAGKYQFRLLIVFIVLNYVVGIVLMSTAFLFQNKSFDCAQHGLVTKKCNKFVCSLPEDMWVDYIGTKNNDFQSLATSFQFYFCSNSTTIDVMSASVYMGGLVGFLVLSFISDNSGRKLSMLLAWGIGTFGTILVSCSFDIYMAAVGLFFAGAGVNSSLNICYFYFGEVVGDSKRQKYSVIMQIFFPLGAIFATGFFYFFTDWRITWSLTVTAPAVLVFLLLAVYLQQTPQFLVKKGVEQTCRVMNKIAKINLEKRLIIQDQDVQNVIECQLSEEFNGKMISPLDLVRFPSLRVISICCSIICFMTFAMYFGPVLIIEDIGFSIYISSIMVQMSQLVIFIPTYFLIQKIPRKKLGIILFCVSAGTALFLFMLQKSEDCDLCIESIIQLIAVFIFRGAVAFFFAFFQIYVCEAYPARARGIGLGMVSAFGTVASVAAPIFIGFLKKNDMNVMIFFVLFSIIAIGCLTLLEETRGKVLTEEIEQIEMEKDKQRSILRRSSRMRKNSSVNSRKSKKSLISDEKVA